MHITSIVNQHDGLCQKKKKKQYSILQEAREIQQGGIPTNWKMSGFMQRPTY